MSLEQKPSLRILPGAGVGIAPHQTFEQKFEMEPPERAVMEAAFNFWETKEHSVMELPLSILRKIFPPRKNQPHSRPVHDPNLSVEFVQISAEEMDQLDPNEKVGIFLGDFVFISDETPEEYIPLAATNLTINRFMSSEDQTAEIFKDMDIPHNMAKHWTANLVDIALAEFHFGENKGKFLEFLKWRKSVELTDFFRNPIIDEALRDKFSYLGFKRTTHPMRRSKYTRRSWVMSRDLQRFNKDQRDRLFRDMNATNVDMLYRDLGRQEGFNPNTMIKLIRHITATRREHYVKGKNQWQVDIDDPEMQKQANLLTKAAAGELWILERVQSGESSNRFRLKSYANRTLEALVDRIAFFSRLRMMQSGMSPQMIKLLREALFTLKTPALQADTTINGGLELAQNEQIFQGQMETLEQAKIELESLIERHSGLWTESTIPADPDIIPQALVKSLTDLQERRNTLQSQIGELKTTMETLALLRGVQRDQGAVMEAIIPGEIKTK